MRRAAMQRKGSFMDDLPPEVGMEAPVAEDYGSYLGDMEGTPEDEMPLEDASMDMEARIATLEERIAALESLLA